MVNREIINVVSSKIAAAFAEKNADKAQSVKINAINVDSVNGEYFFNDDVEECTYDLMWLIVSNATAEDEEGFNPYYIEDENKVDDTLNEMLPMNVGNAQIELLNKSLSEIWDCEANPNTYITYIRKFTIKITRKID